MDSKLKGRLTKIGKIPYFKDVIEKLTLGEFLNNKDSTYILSCALIFLKEYEKNDINENMSYLELAYYIILKYSLIHDDYKPLYDFCLNFGFYPIVKYIRDKELLEDAGIEDLIVESNVKKYIHRNITETLEQSKIRSKVLTDNSAEFSLIAPTSFGKSSIIREHIKLHSYNKIGIIVPTKSLLNQTYKDIKKEEELNYKLILHDNMYEGEERFIGILTQERALRLLDKNEVYFDMLYIDEAHNLFKRDDRSILLARLIKQNKLKNPNHKIIYLSPLVNSSEKLRVNGSQSISEHKINFNVKEPEYYLYELDNKIYKNNRFINQNYPIGESGNLYDYIKENSNGKSFIYNRRPILVEDFAKEFSEKVDSVDNLAVESLKSILKQQVHEDFKIIDLLDKGIIYLHAKLPESIKDFLEYKFKTTPEIKYVVANSVILEGVNLPVETMFILNTYALQGKELTNLIGRVNRLNDIFINDNVENSLKKLIPQIHFVNSQKYNNGNKMDDKIKELRSKVFDDYVANPTLQSYDIDKIKLSWDKNKGETKESKKQELLAKNIKTLQLEEVILSSPENPRDNLLHKMLKNGVSFYYSINVDLVDILLSRIERNKDLDVFKSLNIIDKIYEIFIKDFDNTIIKDYEILRLRYDKARTYYKIFIKNSSKALKEKVNKQKTFFKRIKNSDTDTFYYMGESFGERTHPTKYYLNPKNVYVDLKNKTDKQIVNLSVIKIRLEEDFVSFKLNNYFNLMLELELISTSEYQQVIYGTNDAEKIKLINMGLSINMVDKLQKDGQIQNIDFDHNNNLKPNNEFLSYKNTLDEFSRFKLEKILN